LNVVRDLDQAALPMVQTYQETLNCEALRARIFAGERSPLIFGEPEPWLAMMIEALRLSAQQKHNEAEQLRGEALESAPASAGSVNLEPKSTPEATGEVADPAPPPGDAFQWIADADSRLGPLLEAIVNGRYYWIPFHRIRSVQLEKPTDLRDVVWMPANFEWANGGQAVGMIPTRYAGSESHTDDLIKMARKTAWVNPSAETFLGLGQRMLATDASEYPLMDVREIRIQSTRD
jgi:type VI secretion system protein ImpE